MNEVLMRQSNGRISLFQGKKQRNRSIYAEKRPVAAPPMEAKSKGCGMNSLAARAAEFIHPNSGKKWGSRGLAGKLRERPTRRCPAQIRGV
jgi:hypothetical protein